MRVDKLTIIKDVVTDERKEFQTQTAATAYLREITGRKTRDSMLAQAKNTGRLLYNRYLIEGNKARTERAYVPKKVPDHHLQKGKWLFEEFSFSNSVIIATNRRYKATEEELNNIIDKWQSKILWIRVDNVNIKRQRERNLWYIELYLKLDKDTPFLKKIELMEKTIETIGL